MRRFVRANHADTTAVQPMVAERGSTLVQDGRLHDRSSPVGSAVRHWSVGRLSSAVAVHLVNTLGCSRRYCHFPGQTGACAYDYWLVLIFTVSKHLYATGWLRGLRESSTPLIVGCVLLPCNWLDYFGEQLWAIVTTRKLLYVAG